MAETFYGVYMTPMYYKNEVRQIKSDLLCFLRHRKVTYTQKTSTMAEREGQGPPPRREHTDYLMNSLIYLRNNESK